MRSGKIICKTFIHHELLSYSKSRKEFFMLASDYGQNLRFTQIYPDSVDVGIVVVGKTGRQAVYYLAHTEQQDGDIRFWRFLPTSESLRQVPECYGRVTGRNSE